MGCWNKTCGLSNLDITVGTPVYVFVLERNERYEQCYSTGLFRPLLLPFNAVYDDYGGGENCSGPALDAVMNGLRTRLVERSQGPNPYHDSPVVRDSFDPAQFFQSVHQGRLRIESFRKANAETDIYFTMFRKDVVDAILEKHAIKYYDGEFKCQSATFADIVASVRPLLTDLATDWASLPEGMAECYQNGMGRFYVESKLSKYHKTHLAAEWIGVDSLAYSRIVDVALLINDMIQSGSNDHFEEIEAILIEHVKAAYIEGFMTRARKIWIPGGHEGDQGSSGTALVLLGDIVRDIVSQQEQDEEE